MELEARLKTLCQAIRDDGDPNDYPGERTRVDYLVDEDGFALFFFGDPTEVGLGTVFEALHEPELAAAVTGLWFDGPDVGANGTRSWEIDALVDEGPAFPKLREVHLPQTRAEHHNRTVLGYEEGGVSARLLAKAPGLRSLTLPSAPEPAFFDVPARCVEHLAIDAGYDHHGFVGRLADAENLPSLTALQWGEYCETYDDGWREHTTPVADLERLLASDVGGRLAWLALKNPAVDDETLRKWATLRRDLLVVYSASWYPSHGPR